MYIKIITRSQQNRYLISHHTRSSRMNRQALGYTDNATILRITLRSRVRGLGGLVISIPELDIHSDDDLSLSSEATFSSATITVNSSDDTLSSDAVLVGDENARATEDMLGLRYDIPTHIVKPADLPCNDCAICLEPFKARQHYKKLACEHMFHKRCIDKWLSRSELCPCCRSDAFRSTHLEKQERNVHRFNFRQRR